jgi:hypothetical protein
VIGGLFSDLFSCLRSYVVLSLLSAVDPGTGDFPCVLCVRVYSNLCCRSDLLCVLGPITTVYYSCMSDGMLISGWFVSRWAGIKGRAAGFTSGDGSHCMRLQVHVRFAGCGHGQWRRYVFVLELHPSEYRNLTSQYMIMEFV